ncbi:hypothetical protein [Mitsuokella sp. WILCCON 0060]|uniref:hypothetical protein n=1 Tax=unclassified Mitsuokella TaxID=2637239 RepID=UPI003F112034
MSFDTKEDLAHVCESVINYQKGLEEIEKYIGRLNEYVANLDKELKETDAAGKFAAYGQSLAELQENAEKVKELTESLRDGERGIFSESRVISKFNYNVRHFEDAMKAFNQRVDSLSQKLYNKDFNNAIKAMNTIAEDSKQSATYEYRHVTSHDYDILMHEYEESLKKCKQKGIVTRYLAAMTETLVETKLKRGEFESLQRLTEKMLHSDTKSLQKFLETVQNEKD